MTAPAFDVALFGEAMLLLVANEPGPLENATGFHKRTIGKEDFQNLPLNPRPQGHRGHRLHRPDGLELNRHGLSFCRTQKNGNDPLRCATRRSTALRRATLLGKNSQRAR